MTTPRRPRKCGRCTMFGHDRRKCHIGSRGIDRTSSLSDVIFLEACINHEHHCDLNRQWVAAGGAGHTVPAPKKEEFMLTPFEMKALGLTPNPYHRRRFDGWD